LSLTLAVPVGTLVNRDAYATTGIELNLEKGGIADTVGLVVRVKGDGQMYGVSLTSGEQPPPPPQESHYSLPLPKHTHGLMPHTR